MKLTRQFAFEAVHHLPTMPPGHRCRSLHGHSYRVGVEVEGPVDPATGMVIDFGLIAEAFEPIRRQLDHSLLNDLPGLANPTTELLAVWIWQRLKPVLPSLSGLVIDETARNRCEYHGE